MKNTLLAIACGITCCTTTQAEPTANYLLDEVVVTATRFREPTPIGVIVITSEDIRNTPTASLPELLSMQAGIQVRSNDGSPDMSIDMRGFGVSGNQNTLVLLNGQRLNEIELTSIPWSSIPQESIERIEVLRGSGAVLWGGGATGGVINIITKEPGLRGEKSISLVAGSYDTLQGAISLDHANYNLGFNLAASILTSNNYRDHNAIDRKNIEAAMRLPTRNGDITLRLGGVDQNLELPGPRNRAELETDRRGSNPIYSDDYNTLTGSRAGVSWEGNLGNADANIDLNWRGNHRTALFWGSDKVDTNSDVVSLSPRARLRHDLLGWNNNLIVGLDWDHWNYDSLRESPYAEADLSAGQDNKAIYFNNETSFGASRTLSVGARLHKSKYSAQDRMNTADYASSSADHTLHAWEIAYRHTHSRTTTLYARAGHSFRVPTVDEMFNQYGGTIGDSIVTPLKPQTSEDLSIGMEWNSGSKKVHLAAYHMNIENEIHFNAITFTNMNLSPTRRYGIEAESSVVLSPGLSVFANYTLAIAEFREGIYFGTDVSGNEMPLVPRHSVAIGTDLKITEHNHLSAAVRYVSEQRFDNDQDNDFAGGKMPAYTLVDVKYAHEHGPWRLTLAAHNLLDEKYYTYAVASLTPGSTNFNAYPAAERNFSVSAEYRF